jgi:hypothetical protein
MIEYCKAYIPSGMCRSVEWNTPLRVLHPVKDASPAECGFGNADHYRLFIFHY